MAQSYKLIIRDLMLACEVGVFEHERGRPQRLCLNLELGAVRSGERDELDTVVSYAEIVDQIKELARQGHIGLLETMGEKIAAICFADERILNLKLRIEKLDAIQDTSGVGVEIERSREEYGGAVG